MPLVKPFFVPIFLCLILSSCVEIYPEKDIHGHWKLEVWEIEATGQKVSGIMNMTFDNNRKYSIDYGITKEAGRYWIEGEFLHTVETGLAEKKVKILKLQPDSLILQMNRSGRLEKITLAKQMTKL